MALYTWDNLDEAALYLGLERLQGETNDEFVERTKQFARWKYKTDYLTQSHSIPLQLGLKTSVIARIVNSNKYVCVVDFEYFSLKEILQDGTVGEYLRVFIGNKDCTFRKIVDAINATSTFIINVYNEDDLDISVDYLIRNRNIRQENIKINGKYEYLGQKNIIPGSIRVDSPAYRKEIYSASDLKREGEFFVDYEIGFIQSYSLAPGETNVYYSYYDRAFSIEKTELALLPLNTYFKYGFTDDNIALLPDILNNLVPSA